MNISMHKVLPLKGCATRRKAFLPGGVFLFLAVLAPLAAKAQAPDPFDISQTPLITAVGSVPPNLLYLHDDSGSMTSTMDYNDSIDYVPPLNFDGSSQADKGSNKKNWQEYYNTRQKAAKSAVSRAFINLPDNFRVGWGAINDQGPLTGVRPFGTHKKKFYEWLFNIGASGGTPLRITLDRAGRYYSDAAPWMDDPEKGTGSEGAACRKSFAILMTDGYWNDYRGGPYVGFNNLVAIGNSDSNNDELLFTTPQKPDGSAESYSIAPFRGEGGRDARYDMSTDYQPNTTLADVAWHYWSRDLYGNNTDNKVSGTTRDPAWWQHMTTFTIGLTVSGNQIGKEQAFEAARRGDAIAWPTVIANRETHATKADDLLHAAVNGHGDFFLASNIDEFVKSLTDMLSSIQAASGSNSKLAKMDDSGKNKNKVGDSTYAYEIKYNNTPNWYGQVLAYKACNKNDVNLKVAGCDKVGDVTTAPVWDAGSLAKIGDHANRNILSWNATGINFKFNELSTTQQAQLANPAPNILTPQLNTPNEEAILNYVRGDTSKETAAGAAPNPPFRARNDHLLGDTFSDPLYHGPSASKGYETMSDLSQADQDSYKAWKQDAGYLNTQGMLYIGANDGMLHGFDAQQGNEKIAYVPAAVIPKLWKLADPDYTHEFYADATPIVEEAQLGGNWKNVLVGSTGMGARAYFAIDVTDPQQLSAGKVLWEFTDPDLGFTPGNATVARLKGGKWVAIFGNGYNNDNYTAQLFVVDLKDGSLVKKLDTGVGDAANPNGLGTPKAVDAADLTTFEQGTEDDLNGAADLVYAGDVQGNLWRFDLRDPDPDQWSTSKLLEAKGPTNLPQPITAQPLVVRKRDRNAVSGIMVYVGTGKFFELDDLDDNSVQSFYGVLDTDSPPIPPYSRTNKLVQQTIGATGTVDIDGVTLEAATTSSNLVDYGTGDRGFFIDLTANKERVLTQAQYLPYSKSKGTILIATLVPTGGSCSGGSEGFWMELDALSGKKPEKGAAMLFESQNRVKIGSTPATFHGGTLGNSKLGSPSGGTGTPCISVNGVDCESPPAYCDFTARGSAHGVGVDSLKTCGSPGRKSWRQLR